MELGHALADHLRPRGELTDPSSASTPPHEGPHSDRVGVRTSFTCITTESSTNIVINFVFNHVLGH